MKGFNLSSGGGNTNANVNNEDSSTTITNDNFTSSNRASIAIRTQSKRFTTGKSISRKNRPTSKQDTPKKYNTLPPPNYEQSHNLLINEKQLHSSLKCQIIPDSESENVECLSATNLSPKTLEAHKNSKEGFLHDQSLDEDFEHQHTEIAPLLFSNEKITQDNSANDEFNNVPGLKANKNSNSGWL